MRGVPPVWSSRWLRPSIWVPPVIALGVLAGAWQLYAIHNPYVIPRLQEIFDDLGSRPDLYLRTRSRRSKRPWSEPLSVWAWHSCWRF